MKKLLKRIVPLVLVVVMCCSMLSIGAFADDAQNYSNSTSFHVYGNDGLLYYIYYSNSTYWVGTGYKTGYNGGRRQVGIVQTRMYLGNNFASNTVSQIDGYYGTDTQRAIYTYQSYFSGLSNDGVAGESTLKHCLYTNRKYSIADFQIYLPYTYN